MKEKSAEHVNLDTLLASMPVEPSESFADRVIADYAIDRQLREMPLEPSEDFVEKTLAAVQSSRKPHTLFVFMRRFAAAACIAAVLFLTINSKTGTETSLASRVEAAVQGDPELRMLAQTDEDSISFDELLAASEILSTIDPSVLEILAYND